jgi:outer membrane protein OmpA-like peptidoglycan-associated protein
MKYVSKKMMRISTVLVLGLSTLNAIAQENLVPNGSFEATEGKIKKVGAISSATGWTSPTAVQADLFVPGKVLEINVPDNMYGKEDAKEGANYAGIVAFSVGNKVPRSYLMTKLSTPLKKGMRYCVKFSLSLADGSKYASNQIGINFSKKQFGTEDKGIIKDVAHVLHANNETKKINQMYNWDQVCGIYEATGGEKFITIGNFYPDANTSSETNRKNKDLKINQIVAAYYYIDDVSVELLGKKDKCDCQIEVDQDNYSTTVYQKAVNLNDKMTPTQKIEKHQLFFAFGKSTVTPTGKEALDFVVKTLKENPTMKLEILGHSDPEEDKVGKEKGQYAEMSTKRVDAIQTYFVENGIAEARLIVSPQGSELPNEEISIVDEDDLKQAKNRRVTFKVR